jgi:excisionase family DNA binding protein
MTIYRKKGSRFWQYDFQILGKRFLGSTKRTDRLGAEAVERAERETAEQWRKETKATGAAPIFDDVEKTIQTPIERYHALTGIHPNAPLRTPKEVAAQLGCSLRTLRVHVQSGALRYINVGNGKKRERRMFAESDVDAFIYQQSRKKTSDTPLNATHRNSTGTNWVPTGGGFLEQRRERIAAKQKLKLSRGY